MKYQGSKNRISNYILPIILKDRKPNQWYYEPFVGGANLIDKVDGFRHGSDSNKYVIALLIYLSEGNLPNEITKEKYQSIKNFKDDYPDWLVGYGRYLLFLFRQVVWWDLRVKLILMVV